MGETITGDVKFSQLATVKYRKDLIIPAVDLTLAPNKQNVNMLAESLSYPTINPTVPYKDTMLIDVIDNTLPAGSQHVTIQITSLPGGGGATSINDLTDAADLTGPANSFVGFDSKGDPNVVLTATANAVVAFDATGKPGVVAPVPDSAVVFDAGGAPGTKPISEFGGGGVPENPQDGKLYARKDAAWVETVPLNPQDDFVYARDHGNWVPSVPINPDDGGIYGRYRGYWVSVVPKTGSDISGGIGYYNVIPPGTQPVLTGSKASGAALANLITLLATQFGFYLDSTTA